MDWNIPLFENPTDASVVRCSFCGDSQVPAGEAMTGTDACICPSCLRTLAGAIEGRDPDGPPPAEDLVTCNFCGKQRPRVDDAVAAPEKIHICGDCTRRGAAATNPVSQPGG